MLKPILQGSKIGVITPSSSVDTPEQIRNGLRYLAELGYDVKLGNFVFDEKNHFSGTPQQRAEDIMSFFSNPDISAIVATAGGYGSQAVLPYLDYEIIRQNPKPIIGFSDITALQNAVFSCADVSSVAGIMLKFDFADGENNHTKSSFENILNGRFEEIKSGNVLNKGTAKGVLVGGNFCTLMSLAGTKYFPSLKNKILLLEDVDEKSYRIERMLIQLEQQKDFEELSAIIFGNFRNCELNHHKDKNTDDVLKEFSEKHKNIVMIKDFMHGHIKARYCLPIGETMQLFSDGEQPILKMAE